MNMKATIDVKSVARAEMKISTGKPHRDASDVVWLAPAPDRRYAFANLLIVTVFHHSGHVGTDYTWADLKHADACLCQAQRVKLCHHRYAGLGKAVLRPFGRGNNGIHRRQTNDRARELADRCRQHAAHHFLR